MTRRVLLGTGAVVAAGAAALGGAQLTGRLDDAARAVGLDPKPLPDPDDTAIVRRARTSMALLLAGVEATAAQHTSLALTPYVAIAREHVAALGGATVPSAPSVAADPAQALTALGAAYDTAAADRAEDTAAAFSPDLARVLASMSVGLVQCSRGLRGLR